VACRFKASLVIRRLVEHATAAVTLWASDKNGALPLHVACRSNSSIDDIRFLVGAGGDGTVHSLDHTGALPLHALCEGADPSVEATKVKVEAVKYLLELHPEAVTETTRDGDLPLMVASKASASTSVLQVLLTAYPEALEYMKEHC